MTSVHQKFSIKFMKKGEDTDGIIQGTSGSPGYIDGLPLLIGKGDASGATQIYEDGFRLSGGDIRGHCMGTVSNGDLLAEMGDPTVRFNVDLSYGCILPYTFQELKNSCSSTSTPVANLEIFKNLNLIDTFGRFGNANVYKLKVSDINILNNPIL